MKRVKKKAADEVPPEYNLKRLRVRKLGSGRKSFGASVVRLEAKEKKQTLPEPLRRAG